MHVLTGAKATLAGLRHEIDDWLPSVAKDDDRVLIYFAGHGFVVSKGKGYLAPYDFDLRQHQGAPAIPWTSWARPSAARSTPSRRSCSPMPATAAPSRPKIPRT